MRIFNNDVEVFLESPLTQSGDYADILFGIHIMEGECDACGEPAVGIQLGFLIFTITITVTKSHE